MAEEKVSEELLRSKHAFGDSENIDTAFEAKAIDTYDILFLDGKTEPKVGWIDKDGNAVIVENGVKESVVDSKLDAAKEEVNAYSDKNVETALNEVEHLYEKVDYEISNTPKGTLVDYREKEIRVMCPTDTQWVKQNVGENGDANTNYMAFKAYAPEDAVSFKEGLQGVVDDEMFTFDNDFAGTDEFGRNYSICWLALASYDEETDAWTYFGKNSTAEKYLGWTYVVEWYDADGVIIATDCIRINLSNEDCHTTIEPSYMNTIIATAKAYTDEQIKTLSTSYGVVEF